MSACTSEPQSTIDESSQRNHDFYFYRANYVFPITEPEFCSPSVEELRKLFIQELNDPLPNVPFADRFENAATKLRKRHRDIKKNLKPSEELKVTLIKRPKKGAGRTLTKKLKKLGKKKPPKQLVNKLDKKKK